MLPLPTSAMNRQAGLAASALEARLVVELVLRQTLVGRRTLGKQGVMVQQRRGDLEILLDVSPHMQLATRLEHAGGSVDELVCDEPTPTMLALPPRVRKVDMHRGERDRTQEFVEQKVGVAANHARVG